MTKIISITAILAIISACSPNKPRDNKSLLTDLEKKAISEMPLEKRAFVISYLSNEYYPVDFDTALSAYYKSLPCGSHGSGITASGVAAGVVGGAIINKAIGVTK